MTNYDRLKAVNYAKIWAYGRNDNYYSFNGIGGDCTNFVSQCLYAGCNVMNFTKNLGWYYNNVNDRAPAWTGVEFLRQFLLKNNGENGIVGNGYGPYGIEVDKNNVDVGDVVFLKNDFKFFHSAIIVGFRGKIPLVASHTNDVFNFPLYNYNYKSLSCLHILNVRK